MIEYQHRASGVTAIAEVSRSGHSGMAERVKIVLYASSDPRVPNSPFVTTDRVLRVRENPKNPREYDVPNGYEAEPLVVTESDLERDWTPMSRMTDLADYLDWYRIRGSDGLIHLARGSWSKPQCDYVRDHGSVMIVAVVPPGGPYEQPGRLCIECETIASTLT